MTVLTHKECYLLFPDCRVYTGKYVVSRSSAMFRFANVRCLPRWDSERRVTSRGEWPKSKEKVSSGLHLRIEREGTRIFHEEDSQWGENIASRN